MYYIQVQIPQVVAPSHDAPASPLGRATALAISAFVAVALLWASIGEVDIAAVAEGKIVNLTPGMAATVEIKTGKRKLIEFVLSPLMKMTDEVGRER